MSLLARFRDLAAAAVTIVSGREVMVAADKHGTLLVRPSPETGGAPVWGQKTCPTDVATALAATTTYWNGLTIYPDPTTDVYLAASAITVGTAATTFILRGGGAPVSIVGPIDPSTVFALGSAANAKISFVGQ